MEVTTILDVLKSTSGDLTAVALLVFVLFSFYLKRNDTDIANVTSIGKLQTEQLSTLITQNTQLAEELHAVRKELSEAYKIIDDMRDRITELEEVLKRKSA